MQLDPSQEAAVSLICSAPFAVVTGGPGVGKTTTLRVALDRLDADGKTYALASPTGKAAKRMSEATGRNAHTLHRLLGIGRNGKRITEETIDCDVVVVDESSMLDVELASILVESVEPHTRIVFVGDANQLPSVGPGRVLADLVESSVVPVARLTTVHRAAAESWVCTQAPRVLAGEPLELAPRHDFRFFEVESAEDCARAVAEVVSSEQYRGAQVLAPQRNSACGVDALNLALQARMNPARAGEGDWSVGDRSFRRGDRVIHVKNDYYLEVMNGEVGTVVEVGPRLVVDFEDRQVSYSKEQSFNLELAYALTVHKSQGSEFPWVVCVVHSAHTFMLTRQLFYTGITRAKKGVLLVGNKKGIAAATGNKEPPKRNTALVERMRELMGTDPKQAEGEALPW